ncbi:MAG: YggS family pyridoxal phosphate-dependent enzyme [Saprospiraceae bacterium]
MYLPIKQYCEAHQAELIVVSKLRNIEEVLAVYQQGQRKFAENRVQDLLIKQAQMPEDVQWHLIGTLQTNKVKYIAPFIQLIHSVDDLGLWKEIDRQAKKFHRKIPCLLQIKIAREETKSGFEWSDLNNILGKDDWQAFEAAPIHGVMGMATFTDDQNQVRTEFALLKTYFETLKSKYFNLNPDFKIISMGMSGDYTIAIEEGANMVRIGSLIFEH